MRKTTEIQKEIAKLQKRREALDGEADTALRALETARQGLVSGSNDVAQVTTAQLTHMTLDEALASVDAQLTALRQELAGAQAVEDREAKMRAMVDLAAASTKAYADYEAIRAEANVTLLSKAERLEAAQAAIQQKRVGFLEIFATFCPHAAMQSGWTDSNPERMRAENALAARLLDELQRARGAETAAVQSAMFGPTSQIDSQDLQQRAILAAPLAFAGMFRDIMSTAEAYTRQQANAAVVAERSLNSGPEAKLVSAQIKPCELDWELIQPSQSGGLYRRRIPMREAEASGASERV